MLQTTVKCKEPTNLAFAGFSNHSSCIGTVMADYILVNGIRVAKCWEPEIFGRLTTIGPAFLLTDEKTGKRRAHQVCQCSCGTTKLIPRHVLKSGESNSCGCLRLEVIARAGRAKSIHGKCGDKIYRVWASMVQRCTNENDTSYHNYGGRGIKVCNKWLSFQGFFADMGTPPRNGTLDRIDVNGDYCPENCRWATWKEQQNNRRNNRLFTHNGKTKTLTQWAEEVGITPSNLLWRLSSGWGIAKAVTNPPKRKGK